MNSVWERFFNWQSDMDWAWGPLLPLRPPRDSPIQPWVWVRLFLVFSLLGVLLLGLLAALCVLLPKIAVIQNALLPPSVSETISTLRSMVSDPATVTLLIGLLLALPVLFFAFCLPYHWAWNRRAARLITVENQGLEETEAAIEEGVWPPAPKAK